MHKSTAFVFAVVFSLGNNCNFVFVIIFRHDPILGQRLKLVTRQKNRPDYQLQMWRFVTSEALTKNLQSK